MYILLIILYVIVCVFLICTILLQAGRGGGLTDTFGGAAQDIFGTQSPVILKKATTASAILFIVLSLVLGIITARSQRSLFDRMKFPVMPAMPVEATKDMGQAASTGTQTTETAQEEKKP